MRILLSSPHPYPALTGIGSGLQPKRFPSGSGYLVHDLIAKGLAELGHEVFYLVPHEIGQPAVKGITFVAEPVGEADVLHTVLGFDEELASAWRALGKPWITTCHMDPVAYRRLREALEGGGRERPPSMENWIFVSRTLAQLHGRERHVCNGIDPEEYKFSEAKVDYLLFMSSMDWGMEKGLDVALSLSVRLGFKLVVAGTAGSQERINWVAELCREAKADYVGDVRGSAKADLLAGARAFLFPTKVDEAFGLGMAEALMSGTPVICSDRGACPEIVSPEVGFVCARPQDYIAAIERISEISPAACRAKASRDYHYLRMARDYVKEYEEEIRRHGGVTDPEPVTALHRPPK
jgi:glycosyltransferase involved in cell wall biosynthesis